MKTIGKYEILGLLGRGGMGAAYKVRLPVVGSVAALKLLKPSPFLVSLLGMDEIERRFVEEARMMANLRHHNIAGVRDFDWEDGPERRPFYVMEYYPTTLGGLIGESYRAEKPSRPLGVEMSAHYARQTLEGLARLHHAGVVHRDVKPFNLMICADDLIKITDFGLSKLRGEAATTHAPDSLKIGTPFYCPPEQEADPESVDATADLYAAGVCLYRCLTGRLPVQPDDLEPGRRIPATTLLPELSPDWDDFFHKATHEKPAVRYRTAAAMLADLELLHADWVVRMDGACAPNLELLLAGANPAPPEEAKKRAPRSAPALVRQAEARERFHLDELWRPRHPRSHADLRMDPDFAALVTLDPATGLEWQRSGSPYPLSWPEARDAVARLNAERFAGRDDWRLPTAEELATLLVPAASSDDYCLPPAFGHVQRRVWSADEAGFTTAWQADVRLGFIERQDKSADAWVRAVRAAR